MTLLARTAIWFAFVLTALPAFADITVTATADRNQVSVGESLTLLIEIEGAQNVPAPSLANLPGFQAQAGLLKRVKGHLFAPFFILTTPILAAKRTQKYANYVYYFP